MVVAVLHVAFDALDVLAAATVLFVLFHFSKSPFVSSVREKARFFTLIIFSKHTKTIHRKGV